MMKFCYVDITTGPMSTHCSGSYRDTIAALEREFPDVTFVHVTVPLTTEPEAAGEGEGPADPQRPLHAGGERRPASGSTP